MPSTEFGATAPLTYRILRGILRLGVRVFYRHPGVGGAGKFPDTGPVLLVLNHPNALIDPFMAMLHISRPVYLTATASLLKRPGLGWMMRAGGVIPLYRKVDFPAMGDRKGNMQSLDEVRNRLAAGGVVCIFPEGVSHDSPAVKPLKSGVARVALEYHDTDGNPGGLRIVPAGLFYEEKDRLRSTAWMRVGDPIDIGAWRGANPGASAADLTKEINSRLRSVTLNYRSHSEDLLMRWASLVMAAGAGDAGTDLRDRDFTGRLVELMEALYSGYSRLRRERVRELAAIGRRLHAFNSGLRKAGLAVTDVFSPLGLRGAGWFLARESAILLAGLVPALWGILNNIIPYHLVRRIAVRPAGKDERASLAVFWSFGFFPAVYLVQTALVALATRSWWLAAAYLATVPFAGSLALRYRDRAGNSLQRMRGTVYFLRHPAEHNRLAAEGRGIASAIVHLGDVLEAGKTAR